MYQCAMCRNSNFVLCLSIKNLEKTLAKVGYFSTTAENLRKFQCLNKLMRNSSNFVKPERFPPAIGQANLVKIFFK